jgi:hypothetical protein
VLISRNPSRLREIPAFLVLATLLTGAACADKGSAGASATAQGVVPGDSGKGARIGAGAPGSPAPSAPSAPAAGIFAIDASGKRVPASGTTAGPTPEQEQKAVLSSAGTLPSRSRQDSVALASMTKGDSALDRLWPVKMAAPLPGALLPHNRIVAYYGNPLSKKMGVLGEYPKDEMLKKLDAEVVKWAKADPSHPVVPALHLIATVAQGAPGKNGLYRLQMRDSMVNDIYSWIKAKNGVFFIDVQVGKSTLQAELPRLRPFLENADVHLAVDPEFSMAPSGKVPGTKIGTLDAKDINWAVTFLDQIAKEKNLPPKILIVHRFTRPMVTNAKDIRYTPHVQVVMDMDGWGPPWLKFDSYHDYVKREPVQFTGFKLFYHNDTKKGNALLTPAEVLRLNPKPLYIQYQ